MMNKDTFQGDWNMLKGKIKEKWGKLTDDDITEIKGKKDQLVGKLQKKYGLAKEKAEEQIHHWERTCQSCQHEDKHHEKHHEKHEDRHTMKH